MYIVTFGVDTDENESQKGSLTDRLQDFDVARNQLGV